MSAIQSTSTKNFKRTSTAFDQRLAFSQGFNHLITSATTPVNIGDVVAASGSITLPNVYPMGRNALRVYVDGILYMQAGIDYTEDSPSSITLDPVIVAALNPSTSVIWIEWNRFLPGARDQSLEDLTDVTPDLSGAVRDTGTLRAAPATAANPLATLADTSAVVPLSFTTTAAVLVSHAVYISAASTVARAQADAAGTSLVVGMVIAKPNATTATVIQSGRITGLSGLTVGASVFLSASTIGGVTASIPSSPNLVVRLGIADTTTSFIVRVEEPVA